MPHEAALAIRYEVALFQEIRAMLVKTTVSVGATGRADAAVRQLIPGRSPGGRS